MAYSVKVIVYAAGDSKVIEQVRAAIDREGAKIHEFAISLATDGTREIFVEFLLGDPSLLGHIVRRVEAIPGAAVIASTEPAETRAVRKAKG